MAVSSQGMQDYFGVKSANWLAGYMDCQPRFQFPEPRLQPCNEVETFSERWQLLIIGFMYVPCWLDIIQLAMVILRTEVHFQDKNKV